MKLSTFFIRFVQVFLTISSIILFILSIIIFINIPEGKGFESLVSSILISGFTTLISAIITFLTACAFHQIANNFNEIDSEFNEIDSKIHKIELASLDCNELFNIGLIYYKSSDDKERIKSFDYFKKAALNGHAKAMYNLAICYIYGIGTEKSIQEARTWLNKAKDIGLNLAEDAIKRIDENNI